MARVGIGVEPTLGRPTGIGRYTADLLAALRAVAPEHEYVPLGPARERVMRIDRRLRWQQYELPGAARRAGVDLLHVTGFDAPLRSPVPVVLTVHDLVGVLRPKDHPIAARLYWGRWLPRTVRHADAVVADSQSTRRDVAAMCGVAATDVTVVYPGVAERFGPASAGAVAEVRRRHRLRRPYLLFVGATEPRKGIDTLLAAFSALCGRCPHDLVLAGPLTRTLPAISSSVPPGRVHVLGYVADDDLPALYTGADVAVLPSRHEGFGFPVVEAMACGTPVVCTPAGAMGEVTAGAALLVAPDHPTALGEAVARVIETPSLAEELRTAGARRAKEFDWRRAAADTARVYAAVAR
ncbi:MAG: glycosyltransferase family 4 protein [Acidimicrobiales bacterium]